MMRRLIAIVTLLLTNAAIAQGVQRHGPLQLGNVGPLRPGDPTSHPYRFVPVSRFYVLVVAKGIPTMCVFEECGEGADMVRRLGGWITGDDQGETIAAVGLCETRVRRGEQSIIVVADRRSRIVGIYPNQDVTSLSEVLKLHRNLWQPGK